MVLLELQPPSTSGQHTFQQIDALTALQQLESQRSLTVRQAKSALRDSNNTSSLFSLPKHSSAATQHKFLHQIPGRYAAKAKTRQQQYCNDGMRLSDVGEEPFAMATPRSPLRDTTVEQPDSSLINQASTSERSAADADFDLEFSALASTSHTGYICSTRNDPLVKGR